MAAGTAGKMAGASVGFTLLGVFRQFLFPGEGGVKAQTLLFITECYRFNSTFRKAL